MYTPGKFAEDDLPTLQAFIEAHPLAAIVTNSDASGLYATHVPLILDRGAGSNFHDDPAFLRGHLEALTTHHESKRETPWRVSDAPEDFIAQQMRAIVAVEFTIERLEGKWKMSQNRVAADVDGVVEGLGASKSARDRDVAAIVTDDATVALRLPSPDREAFLKKYKTSLAAHYEVVQPEYVVVPDKLLAKTAELKPYFDASVSHVAALKPKATTKKKPARKK